METTDKTQESIEKLNAVVDAARREIVARGVNGYATALVLLNLETALGNPDNPEYAADVEILEKAVVDITREKHKKVVTAALEVFRIVCPKIATLAKLQGGGDRDENQ